MRRLIFAGLGLLALIFQSTLAHADNVNANDAKAKAQHIVEQQVAALSAGDADKAFSYATPHIQQQFGSAENFLVMVEFSYGALVHGQSFKVEAVETAGDHAAVRAHVVGKDGRAFKAIYPLRRQPDGQWRIDGCYLEPTDGRML